jgi:hypothetical protein
MTDEPPPDLLQLRIPPELQATITEASQRGAALVLTRQFGAAFEIFRRVYARMLELQPPGRRFHKGEPLANMGWAQLRAGNLDQGAMWTAQAFIEDCLSRAEDQPGVADELAWPAAQNLRAIGASDHELLDLSQAIRGLVSERQLFQDPAVLYFRFNIAAAIGRWLGGAPEIIRIRVFVSSPSELKTERRIIAEICRELTLTLPATVEALLWEGAGARNPESQPFPPAITGLGAQAVIDDHVWGQLGGYSVYMGMLWRSMGTRTGAYGGGTEAEFRYAYDRFAAGNEPRKIFFYEKRSKPARVRDAEAVDFLRELRLLGLLTRFNEPEDLRRAAFSHLAGVVREALGQR